MKENLTKAFVAFYYFCLLIYVPIEAHIAENRVWTYGWEFLSDLNGESVYNYHHVDWDRLILQLLAGTCVLLMIRYLIPVFSKEQERSDRTDD